MEQEKKVRSFIALDIGDDVRRNLSELQSGLKEHGADVKWVRPEGIHCTLRFLGNISSEEIDLAHQAIIEAAAGRDSFEAEVKGIGMFPDQRRPRVIWVGIETGRENLVTLFEALEKGLVARGFGPADRSFQAHLTLGRVKSPRGMDRLMKSLVHDTARSFGRFTVDRLILFKSKLHPAGAIYSVLQEAPLSR